VDSREIAEYHGFLQRGGQKPATINRRFIALRRFFAWAKKQDQAPGSPFELLEEVRVPMGEGHLSHAGGYSDWISPDKLVEAMLLAQLPGRKRA
jgi:hypothetical protein